MCLLNFVSIRIGRKLFPNQFSKKIYKKHKFIRKRKKFYHQGIHSPTPTPSSPPPASSPPFQEIYIAGRPVLKPPPSPITITWIWNTGDVRNWLQLPPEITLRIFTKLETIDILLTVSQVCSSWRNLSKEPVLYRSIVIGGYDPIFRGKWMMDFTHIARKAMDRSCGKLVQFSCANMDRFVVHDLQHILDSSTSIKTLGIGMCYVDLILPEQIFRFLKHIPSLEQLFLHSMGFAPSDVQDIGFSCPKLKYLQIGVFDSDVDAKALQIAKSMPGLRRLHLLSNNLTINGFQAILNGCPHLEYMNIKGFYNVGVDLSKKHIHRIKSSTLLNKNDEFGEEREFYLKPTSDGQHIIEQSNGVEEELTDYGGLSLYKSSFVDYNDPYFKFHFDNVRLEELYGPPTLSGDMSL